MAARENHVHRSGQPARHADCRAEILWATIRRLDGTTMRRPVNAAPIPHGRYAYVAGSIASPVLRELDDEERAVAGDEDRYGIHRCEPSREALHEERLGPLDDTERAYLARPDRAPGMRP